MILLSHDGFELGLAPELGGTVTHFRRHGADLLRPATGTGPTEMAAFPMIPFSGRIGHGRFHWRGRDVALAPNFPPEPHAIHGQAWRLPWRVATSGPGRALLTCDHGAGDWPWAWRAEQEFRLTSEGLAVELRLTNLSAETMPAGIGWHPYFPAAGAEIEADTAAAWQMGADKLPLDRHLPGPDEQLRERTPVGHLSLDTPFETAGGPLHLHWPEAGRTLRILTDNTLRFLVVYTPPGEDYFCAEPVSHVPNMMNLTAAPRETGLVALAPGETLTGRIRMELLELRADQSATEEARTPIR